MLSDVRKFLVSVAAAVGVLVSMGLLSGDIQHWVIGIITAANAGLVYWVPNGKRLPAADDSAAFEALMQQNEVSHFYSTVWPESGSALNPGPL